MRQPEWNDCLNDLPLVLAGPLLRHTTADSVTVWLALKQSCTVDLKVYDTHDAGQQIGACLLNGQRSTVAIGQFLHVVAITARSPQADLQSVSEAIQRNCLHPNCLYAYDLNFSTAQQHWTLEQALISPEFPTANISYFAHQKPTFSLPPAQLTDLKIVQGSCRKPHGDGYDALAILDDLIDSTAPNPRDRPHQLFLTGDQIYGDDVADPMLWMASGLGDALLGWQETLPIAQPGFETIVAADLPPGSRAEIATKQAGFTAGLQQKRAKVKSHLLSLGEYYASYLLAWSPVGWAIAIPPGQRMQRRRSAHQWDQALEDMQQFVQTLPQVRRALANVPTYMMFDDHEVSDDWNLNRAWCLRVYGKPLGRRVVQNALLAYAVFQAWGNTPEQFTAERSGEKLLEWAQQWSLSGGQDKTAEEAIARYTGMPLLDEKTGLPQFVPDELVPDELVADELVADESLLILSRHPDALTWHYTLKSHCHEVVVLDTRTWRGYPAKGKIAGVEVSQAIAPPRLLSPTALAQQVVSPFQQPPAAGTFLILPTNLFGLQAIDWIHHWQLRQKKVFSTDVGDAWNINTDALAKFLATLFSHRRSVVVLSGDIHYSTIVHLHYQNLVSPGTSADLIQLTCSALKNEELITRILHTRLKDWLLPERMRRWVGWQHPPRMVEMKSRRLPAALSQPDWSATLAWVPRQTTQRLNWRSSVVGEASPLENRPSLGLWWRRFWLWIQDGEEVVGVNNLGMVSFQASSQETDSVSVIIHTVYWLSFWHPPEVFYSRFACELAQGKDPSTTVTIA
jgi:hypothetical protein